MKEPEGKRPLRRRRHEWMILKWFIENSMDWIDLAQDRYCFESSCEHSNEPSGFIHF
jgi:hypothetical protein